MGDRPYQKTCVGLPIHTSIIESASAKARRGDIRAAVIEFRNILKIGPGLNFNAEKRAKRIYANSIFEEGIDLTNMGLIREAIVNFERAQQIDTTFNIDFRSWEFLCWKGALTGFAQEVIPICERSVRLAPDSEKYLAHNSRGVARAMTTNYSGAIEDFKVFIEWSKTNDRYEEAGKKREEWVKALEGGENPFNEVTLETLRNE
jgi:tetratricopeptide (TPR) repeat protein